MGLPSSLAQHGYTCLASCNKFLPSWRTIIGIDYDSTVSFQLRLYAFLKPPYQHIVHIDIRDHWCAHRALCGDKRYAELNVTILYYKRILPDLSRHNNFKFGKKTIINNHDLSVKRVKSVFFLPNIDALSVV